MKFRFCGDQDCPDWVLAEIALLTKISSVKMKLVSSTILKHLTGADLDYAKLDKLTSDAKFGAEDLKAFSACLIFILRSAGCHDVDGDTLGDELQQLGLPKESATAICKAYDSSCAKLKAALQQQTLRVSSLASADWRVDYVMAGKGAPELNDAAVQLRLTKQSPDGAKTSKVVSMDAATFRVFVQDMRRAQAVMHKLEDAD